MGGEVGMQGGDDVEDGFDAHAVERF